jgi:hypothetical protein
MLHVERMLQLAQVVSQWAFDSLLSYFNAFLVMGHWEPFHWTLNFSVSQVIARTTQEN